jgi:hypothetical protein
MGPMFHAVFAFVIVQVEIQTQMLGILRGLGLRDSVFWASWWIPFLITSFLNALGGAITTSALSVHAFKNIYFMGIFGSFFFLNIALVGASLFLASFCGTARGGTATWCIVLLLVAQWAPYLTQVIQAYPTTNPEDLLYNTDSPNGLFWTNRNTTRASQDYGFTCDVPIISKEQGGFFKTEQEQLEFPEGEWFVGCYFTAGYVNSMWNQDKSIGLAILFMFPYVHFMDAWGNFLGFTGMPDRRFGYEHASMSAEELAIASLPVPPDSANGRNSTLFAQGATLNVETKYYLQNNFDSLVSNCPAKGLGDFCSVRESCPSASEVSPTESPSVLGLFGFLFCLSIIYTLMAAYWAQVFPGKVRLKLFDVDGALLYILMGSLTSYPLSCHRMVPPGNSTFSCCPVTGSDQKSSGRKSPATALKSKKLARVMVALRH